MKKSRLNGSGIKLTLCVGGKGPRLLSDQNRLYDFRWLLRFPIGPFPKIEITLFRRDQFWAILAKTNLKIVFENFQKYTFLKIFHGSFWRF